MYKIEIINRILEKINVALVDGLHTYKQALADIENCLQHINKKGAVVVHDCNPASKAMAHPALSLEQAAKEVDLGKNNFWTGDVWKAIVHLRSTRKDLNIFVLDCDFGVGVITFGNPENMLDFKPEEIEKMTYDNLEKNRAKFLNLKPKHYFDSFLKT